MSVVLSRALQVYLDRQDEQRFQAAFRLAARKQRLTSQNAITHLVDDVRGSR